MGTYKVPREDDSGKNNVVNTVLQHTKVPYHAKVCYVHLNYHYCM